MSKCIQCARIDLQASAQFSKLGMAHCPMDKSGTYKSIKFERKCSSFQPAPAAIVVKREMWAEKI